MKKYYRFLSGVLLAVMIFTLTACSVIREPITAWEFMKKVEMEGYYERTDAKDQFEEGEVEEVILAFNGDVQIEFYVFPTMEKAQNSFGVNIQAFQKETGSSNSDMNVIMKNYGYYTQTGSGKFYVVAYIDNTMIYSVADEAYKKDVYDLITYFGYLSKEVKRPAR